jgi:hypothetical protein
MLDMPDMRHSARLFRLGQSKAPIHQHIQHIGYRPTLAMRDMPAVTTNLKK